MINIKYITKLLKSSSFLFLILAFQLVSCKSQQAFAQVKNDSSIPINFKQIEVDAFGNIYLLTDKNVLQKFDSNRKLLFEYSFNRQGEISRIDVSNPQKILVYLPQYQNLVFLDNTLSNIRTLNLESLGYWAINSVALSNDNQIWIYDPTIHQLIKINDSGQKILASNELFEDSLNDNQISRIMVDKEKVYLAGTSQVLCFTQFGQFDKIISLEFDKIQLFNNQLLILSNNQITRQGLTTEYLFDENDIVYTSKIELVDFKLGKDGKLYLLDNSDLIIHKL